MSTPGSNLLNQALGVIASQTIQYIAYLSRSKTATGSLVSSYAPPKPLQGSIQPVGRQLMLLLGLDMQKHYVTIFVSNRVIDVRRDVASDKFMFNGVTFQALSITKWLTVDSWNQVLAVEVPS